MVDDIGLIASKFEALAPALNERARRVWAATEAKAFGRGGIAAVSRATGISVSTIRRGLEEVDAGDIAEPGRVRRRGGGRKNAAEQDPTLLADLEGLVEPTASGDPQSPLRWTSKSVRKLAAELAAMGHSAVTNSSRNFSISQATVFRRIARRVRVRTTQIETRSSASSTVEFGDFKPGVCQ